MSLICMIYFEPNVLVWFQAMFQ